MGRKLFCEIHPVTYQISVGKNILKRNLQDLFNRAPFALTQTKELLSHLAYKHHSLIRRKLGNVRLDLQENKATNLNIAAPKGIWHRHQTWGSVFTLEASGQRK